MARAAAARAAAVWAAGVAGGAAVAVAEGTDWAEVVVKVALGARVALRARVAVRAVVVRVAALGATRVAVRVAVVRAGALGAPVAVPGRVGFYGRKMDLGKLQSPRMLGLSVHSSHLA